MQMAAIKKKKRCSLIKMADELDLKKDAIHIIDNVKRVPTMYRQITVCDHTKRLVGLFKGKRGRFIKVVTPGCRRGRTFIHEQDYKLICKYLDDFDAKNAVAQTEASEKTRRPEQQKILTATEIFHELSLIKKEITELRRMLLLILPPAEKPGAEISPVMRSRPGFGF
jgi:hypothetical protein